MQYFIRKLSKDSLLLSMWLLAMSAIVMIPTHFHCSASTHDSRIWRLELNGSSLCREVLCCVFVDIGPCLDGIMSMTGYWSYLKSENFDEYMKAAGIGFALRKLAGASKPATEITKATDDVWKIRTWTSFKTTNLEFKSGQPFDEETADGRKCKSMIKVEKDRMIHEQNCGGKDYRIIREFKGDEMVITLVADGVTAKRYYKRDGTEKK